MDSTVHFAARAIDAVRSAAAEEMLPRHRSIVATCKDAGSLITGADLAAQTACIEAIPAAIAEVSLGRDMAGLRGALKNHLPYPKRLTRGSSALPWCDLAAARIAVMLDFGQKMGDYAAGALILEAARGFARMLDHDDFWTAPVWKRSDIAARGSTLLEEWRGGVHRQAAAAR